MVLDPVVVGVMHVLECALRQDFLAHGVETAALSAAIAHAVEKRRPSSWRRFQWWVRLEHHSVGSQVNRQATRKPIAVRPSLGTIGLGARPAKRHQASAQPNELVDTSQAEGLRVETCAHRDSRTSEAAAALLNRMDAVRDPVADHQSRHGRLVRRRPDFWRRRHRHRKRSRRRPLTSVVCHRRSTTQPEPG